MAAQGLRGIAVAEDVVDIQPGYAGCGPRGVHRRLPCRLSLGLSGASDRIFGASERPTDRRSLLKVLVDECVDWRLSRDIVGHEVKTARQMEWSTIKNGDLLSLAAKQFAPLKVSRRFRCA
jgi:hypothetical protein